MKGFITSVTELISMTGASDIHEVGCGEGRLSTILAKENRKVRASDFSKKVIDKVRTFAKANSMEITFKVANIFDLSPEKDAAEGEIRRDTFITGLNVSF